MTDDDDARFVALILVELTLTESARPGLTVHLRNLAHAEFLELIQSVYKSFLNAVEGLQAQGAAFLEVLESTRYVE